MCNGWHSFKLPEGLGNSNLNEMGWADWIFCLGKNPLQVVWGLFCFWFGCVFFAHSHIFFWHYVCFSSSYGSVGEKQYSMASKDHFEWKLSINMQKILEIKSWKLYWRICRKEPWKSWERAKWKYISKMTKNYNHEMNWGFAF